MIYIVIGIYLLALAIQFDFRGKGSAATRKFHFRLAFLILVALMAFRYRVGGDTLRYMDSYEHYVRSHRHVRYRRSPATALAFTEQLPALDLAEIPVVPDRPRIVHQYRILFILQKILEIPVRRHFPVLHIPLFHFQYGGNPGIFRNRLLPALHRCLPAETVLIYYLYIAIAFLFHAGAIFLIIVPFLFNWKIRPLSIFVVCGGGSRRLVFFSKHVLRQHLHVLE